MSNHKYKEYKEFGRTEIAVTGFVLNRLLTRPDVASSHFAMQEVIPENVKKAACVKGDPGYKYYLIQLGALDAEKMKVAVGVIDVKNY